MTLSPCLSKVEIVPPARQSCRLIGVMFVKCCVNCEVLFQYFTLGHSFTGTVATSSLCGNFSHENSSVFCPDEEIMYINTNPGTIGIHVLIDCTNKALVLGLKINIGR